MKKIIVMLILVLGGFESYAVVEGNKNNPGIPIKVRLELDFGRNKLGCKEFGLCIKDIGIDFDFGPINGGGYIGALTNENGSLELSFNKADLSSAVLKKYFVGEYFVIDEDVVLNSKYLLKIDLPERHTIKAGQYKIKRLENSYVIMLE